MDLLNLSIVMVVSCCKDRKFAIHPINLNVCFTFCVVFSLFYNLSRPEAFRHALNQTRNKRVTMNNSRDGYGVVSRGSRPRDGVPLKRNLASTKPTGGAKQASEEKASAALRVRRAREAYWGRFNSEINASSVPPRVEVYSINTPAWAMAETMTTSANFKPPHRVATSTDPFEADFEPPRMKASRTPSAKREFLSSAPKAKQPAISKQRLHCLLNLEFYSSIVDASFRGVNDAVLDEFCRFIRDAPAVHEIRLSGNSITCQGALMIMEALNECPNVKFVDLSHNNIGNTAVAGNSKLLTSHFFNALAENTSIEHLSMRGNHLTGGHMLYFGDVLRRNFALKSVDLAENKLGIQGGRYIMEGLRTNEMMQDCQLSKTHMSTDMLLNIAQRLRDNRLCAQHLPNRAGAKLKQVQRNRVAASKRRDSPHNSSIFKSQSADSGKSMKFGYYGDGSPSFTNEPYRKMQFQYVNPYIEPLVNPDNIPPWQTSLSRRSAREEPVFSQREDENIDGMGNREGTAAREFLTEGDPYWEKALSAHNGTINLDLSDRDIDDRGAYTVARFIEHNPYLKVLDLADNRITGRGAALIGHALARNRALRELDLSGNPLGEGIGLLDFCRLVGYFNSHLSHLWMRMCKLSGYHGQCLEHLLAPSRSLTHIDFSFNEFGVLGGELLLHACLKNFMLLQVQVSGCRMEMEVMMKLAQHLKENSIAVHRDLSQRKSWKP